MKLRVLVAALVALGLGFYASLAPAGNFTGGAGGGSGGNAPRIVTGDAGPFDGMLAKVLDDRQSKDCWIEDFRKNLPKNTVPTLILHGDADRILPPDATSRRQAKQIKNVKYVELPGGPHGVLWTHADQINSELVSFLR